MSDTKRVPLKMRSVVMKIRVQYPLPGLAIAAALALLPLAAPAQDAPMMTGGSMKGGEMMKSGDMMGCDMMGGGMMGNGMMGGGMDHMRRMMSMMHEKLAHAGDRVDALKAELKITEAQIPAWNKFADALLAAAKSTDESMDAMHKNMMESGAAVSLPDKLQHHAKMASAHLTNLNSIKAALDPLYASLNDEQKKVADGLRIGPMGLM
jgi:LTXXQ motif family protein